MAGIQQAPVNLLQPGALPPQSIALAQRTVLQPHNLIVQQPRPTFIQTLQPQQQILRQVVASSRGSGPFWSAPALGLARLRHTVSFSYA